MGGKDHTLALAKELGATHTTNRKTCPDIAVEIKKITGDGANYAIDTSGNVNFVRTAWRPWAWRRLWASSRPWRSTCSAS